MKARRVASLVLATVFVIAFTVAVVLLLRTGLRAWWDDDRQQRDGACIGCGVLVLLSAPVSALVGMRIVRRFVRRT